MTKKIGRPTLYTEDLAKEICETISSTSKGIKVLCKENSTWPHPAQVYKWLVKYPFFRDLYALARRNQIQIYVDEIVEISDDSSRDTCVNEDGKKVTDHEHINRARLRVDSRKWIAGKLVPRLYGDKFLDKETSDSLISKIIDKL